MNELEYLLLKVRDKFFHNTNSVNHKYRKLGMHVGKDTHIFCNINSSEPYLISIGDHTTVATNAVLLTHDASIGALGDRSEFSDLCGRITIGNHCFIGSNAIVLAGVCLGDRCVVAAGSVVTKSFPEGNVVLAGNPARVVCSVEDYLRKHRENFYSLHGLSYQERKKCILSQSVKLIDKKKAF